MPRVSVQYRTTSKENYERFCVENPEVDISFDKWKEILYSYIKIYTENILETGEKNKIPFGFGGLSINKKKSKRTKEWNGKTYINLPIDWQKTKKEGKIIYNLNYHTDGYRYRWVWFKEYCHFYGSDLYVFKPSRELSKKLASYLKNPNADYKEIYREWLKK